MLRIKAGIPGTNTRILHRISKGIKVRQVMVSLQKASPFSGSLTTGLVPQSSEFKFVDEKFEVIPTHVPTKPPLSGGKAQPEGRVSLTDPDFTEDDLMFMTESIWSLPNIIWDKMPPRDPEKVKAWNRQLYRYCIKKNLNPWEWFFDELPLAMATIGLAGGIWGGLQAAVQEQRQQQDPEQGG